MWLCLLVIQIKAYVVVSVFWNKFPGKKEEDIAGGFWPIHVTY